MRRKRSAGEGPAMAAEEMRKEERGEENRKITIACCPGKRMSKEK